MITDDVAKVLHAADPRPMSVIEVRNALRESGTDISTSAIAFALGAHRSRFTKVEENPRRYRLAQPETEPRPPFFMLYKGKLAYLDTTQAGLVPCKVISVDDDERVTVKVTAQRRGYHRGEIIGALIAGQHVVPRTAVFTKGGRFHIAGNPVKAHPDSLLNGEEK